ncbi:hypothetical protein C5U62_07780 [Pseudomonas protegens]|uniref:Uncharacterized protein n=1 Tax=Pseudomonas protegens TaxID=380021 RepID=A0A2T6GMJ9_9PSED|nr:hypothetical protein C5U62_07780 [Pseudomonas protegens]
MHRAVPRRSRLAGEGARKPCTACDDAFAGKPAPTAVRCTAQFPVGAGLPAKGPASLAPPVTTPSLASQRLQQSGAPRSSP